MNSLAELEHLRAQARQLAVPYGSGHILWHVWGAGKPTVIFHGGSGSWTHWCKSIEVLVASGRELWLPDLPGFGDSARPLNGEDGDSLPEPLWMCLDQLLGPTTRFDLIGFSFGGMVAGFMAQQRSERLDRLILLGAPVLPVKSGQGSQGPQASAVNATPIPRHSRALALKPWVGTPPGPARDELHRYNLAALMFSGPEAVDELAVRIHDANLVRDRLQKRRMAGTDALQNCLRQVKVPIFGIWGEQDALFRGRSEELLATMTAMPALRRIQLLPGAGHWVQYEAPQATNALLLNYLQECVDVA